MSKDQTIGALILAACAVIAIGYTVGLFLYPLVIRPWLNIGENASIQFWLIAVPVFVGFMAILLIGAWIGYTMTTTPTPKPIEEIQAQEPETTDSPTATKKP